MTETEANCVDKMLTKFIRKTAYGVRADFYKKAVKKLRYEDNEVIIYERILMETGTVFANVRPPESRITLSIAECGLCARCPNNLICAALDELTEKQQIIIIKIFFEKYTEKEVAMFLGTYQQDVHYHKNTALKRLGKILPEPIRRKPQQQNEPFLFHSKGGEHADGL